MFHHKKGSFLLCIFFIGKLTDALNGFWTHSLILYPFLSVGYHSNPTEKALPTNIC